MFAWKLILAILTLAKADFPIDFEEPISRNDNDIAYRLPESLDPVHFEVEITPYFEATDTKPAFIFDGRVSITVTAKEAVSVLTLHENVREILSVTVTDSNGVPMALNASHPFQRVRQYHFLQINLNNANTLAVGQNYSIKIEYVGNINETPLSRGVFRGSYNGTDGKQHWYAACHLQPVNSRQAFPSFDEPGYKSTFEIIINRPAHFTNTFGNMKIKSNDTIGNRVREVFHTTPRMSAYLISFHISEEFTVIADNNDTAKSYRVIARPEAAGQGAYALEVGPPITKWLEDYLGIEYYTMGYDMKNDQIAVPDWASGATENWGLVSYRENRLLYDENETNLADKQATGVIIAHELTHKWFGNLITCKWWNNVWINEGFASYFEYFSLDGVDPSLELHDQFNLVRLQSALSTDSSTSTRALEHEVNTPTQVTGHFSGISYTKGASFLNMLKYFLTENTFKKALNYFLIEKSYEHALPTDLFEAFTKAVDEDSVLNNINIAEFMKYWVENPGYPVLDVEVNMENGEINLEQERFFISPSAAKTEQVWPLPLTFTSGNNPNWDDLKATHVMVNKTYQIKKDPGHEWVIFNVKQAGFYRVNYDQHNWEKIADALSENIRNIHYLNRAQIVDDVFALMRSERMSYELGFKVLSFLKQDTSYYSWYPAITGFSWLRNRFLHIPGTLAQFDEVLFEFLSAVIEDVGYSNVPEEPITKTLNRFYVMFFACNSGHPGCISNAVEQFTSYRNSSSTSVNPNVRRHVFCTGIREGNYDDWQAIYRRHLDSNNYADQVIMLRALGCTSEEQAVKEYLHIVMSNYIKAQDRANAFSYLLMGHSSNAKIVLEFLKENLDEVRSAVVLPSSFNTVLSNVASYLDEEGLQDMEAWLQSNQSTIPEASVGLNAIASVRANMKWGNDKAGIIIPAMRGNSIAVVPSVLVLVVALVSVIIK